jgi:hypothetical protein
VTDYYVCVQRHNGSLELVVEHLKLLALSALLAGTIGFTLSLSLLSSGTLLSSGALLVGLCVEVNEKQEVAAEQSATEVSSILRSSTVTKGRESRVGIGEVSVSAEVDDEKIDDKLDNLHGLIMRKMV